jgi:hypothetical protein
MATYYGTYGQKVQYLASDPSDPQIGQVWYNSTSATLKVRQTVATNSWASGGTLPAGTRLPGGAGTQTAAIVFGGISPGNVVQTTTRYYDGTTWSTPPASMNTGRYGLGSANAGTQTAALGFGGDQLGPVAAATESYNGTSWTSVNSLNTARAVVGGAGTQTAALAFGGSNPPGTRLTSTETWNGTSWTASGALPVAKRGMTGFGIQTAAISAGGESPVVATTESFNGSTWTAVSSMNTARTTLGGAGTQTAGLGFGGYVSAPVGNTTATELWNGTSWTSNPTGLGSAKYGPAGSGTQASALSTGGNPAPVSATSEEWTGTVTATKTVTVS